jgi:hypothetical protein
MFARIPSSYQKQLRNPLWQRRRLEIFHRDGWQCQSCGETGRELQVHHRWYTGGLAPWESPDIALVTLCVACHERVSMNKLPEVTHQSTLADTYGSIRVLCVPPSDYYLAQEDVEKVVSEHIRYDPEAPKLRDILWLDYLKFQGGAQFRQHKEEALRKDPKRLSIPPLQFTDDKGTKWLLSILAVHFVAKYYSFLEYRIYEHFDRFSTKKLQEDAPTLLEDEDDNIRWMQIHLDAAKNVQALKAQVANIDEKYEKKTNSLQGEVDEINGKLSTISNDFRDGEKPHAISNALRDGQKPLPSDYLHWECVFPKSVCIPPPKSRDRRRFYDIANRESDRLGKTKERRFRDFDKYEENYYHKDVLKVAFDIWHKEMFRREEERLKQQEFLLEA